MLGKFNYLNNIVFKFFFLSEEGKYRMRMYIFIGEFNVEDIFIFMCVFESFERVFVCDFYFNCLIFLVWVE